MKSLQLILWMCNMIGPLKHFLLVRRDSMFTLQVLMQYQVTKAPTEKLPTASTCELHLRILTAHGDCFGAFKD